VFEWCSDWFGTYPGGGVTDPTGPNSGSSGLIRGGSWYDGARDCRSIFRRGIVHSLRRSALGFRVALAPVLNKVIEPPPQQATKAQLTNQENQIVSEETPNRKTAAVDIPDQGNPWTVPELGLKMVWIKPGTFTMGNPESEKHRRNIEGPQTQVTVSKGLWLGKFEVTQGEYEKLIGSNPSYTKSKGKRAPVETVSWDDAVAFSKKLTDQERQADRLPSNYEYRLPTDAEWEYACRAGTTTRFSYGDDLEYNQLNDYGWYRSNSNNTSHLVGEKKPNPWGIYDMHGNVEEWCLDYNTDFYWRVSMVDPTGTRSGTSRVFRGGSRFSDARYCQSAYRSKDLPSYRSNVLGFRVALAPSL